jgi:hypothetical protein
MKIAILMRGLITIGAGLVGSLAGSGQTGTALVRHAPTLNGSVDGSIQQMLAENTTLNGGAAVTGDLLVPGTPTVRLNGKPAYGGTLDGSGATMPSSHQVTLNGNTSLRHVVRRTDPVALPVVVVPPTPAGTRTVVIGTAGQTAGDFATLRHLTLNGNVGQCVIPPGAYGDFTVNGGSGLSLGIAGSTQPSVYHFQRLILNGKAEIRIVGPVVLTVANGFDTNGSLGSAVNPAWLILNIYSGGLTLNGGGFVYGYVNAPAGTVTVSGNSQLVGGVACDRLTVDGGGRLRLLTAAGANRPPAVALTAPVAGAVFPAPAAFTLAATASDPDGTVTKVEFFQGTTKLGEDAVAPFEWNVSGLIAGTYTFTARAADNLGATGDAPPVTIVVTSPNQPPTVAITAPADGALFTAPAAFTLVATAADADGTVAKVEFFQGTTRLGEDTTAPYEWPVAGLAAGTYTFTARAVDNLGAAKISAPATVTVINPNLPPTVALTAPANGAVFPAPATFTLAATAADVDGTVTKVEFFQGTTKLGEDATALYEWSVTGLTAGTYTFLARATDDRNGATDSAPLTVTVTSPNQPPTVALVAPADGAVYAAPATVDVTAIATDPDGTVARVDFLLGRGGAASVKAGEATAPRTPPSTYALTLPGLPPGGYTLAAQAFDNAGASATTPARSVTVRVELPYFTGFETAEGYTVGPLAGQAGWTATNGAAVAAATVFRDAQAVVLAPGQPPAEATHEFPPVAGQAVVFVDCQLKPAAGAAPDTAVVLRTAEARVAFVAVGAQGELYAQNGAGLWQPTGVRVALAGGIAAEWLRVTLREDFASRRWDLYLNGRMVAADLAFAAGAGPQFGMFALTGHATAATVCDDFFAGFDNPLFVDADKDGMDDAWELAHGLDPTRNDRAGDKDGDGLSNLREFLLGTKPNAVDSDGDGLPDAWEVRWGTNPNLADAAADPDGDGLTNAQEFALGRNPLKGAVPDTAGNVNLRIFTPAR